jgi:hypothetical protein
MFRVLRSLALAIAVFSVAGIAEGARPARAQAIETYFYNVKATVATQATWTNGVPFPGRPVRWVGTGVWFSEDQGFVSEACVLAVYPYGNLYFDNGYVEFPGLTDTAGTLGYKCWNLLQENRCIYLDGHVLSQPDHFGQKVIISAVRPCWGTL